MPDGSTPEEVAVLVRGLPEGPAAHGIKRRHKHNLLELEMNGAAPFLRAGALVEIESEEAFFLGQVDRREASQVWVVVEHKVDRVRLKRIHDTWNNA